MNNSFKKNTSAIYFPHKYIYKICFRNLTNIIVGAFPDTLVLPVLGNHDIYPAHQFPVGSSQYYDGYPDMWKMWINTPDAQATFKKGWTLLHYIDSSQPWYC